MPLTGEAKRASCHRYYLTHKAEANERSRQWYYSHRQDQQARARKYNLAIKQEVLTHYGNGKCACVKCGESRLACLSIDHINGRGGEHRKYLGWGGIHFYLWLKEQGYPDGYQTLCMNDQWVKRVENKEYAPNGVVSG